MKKVVMKTVTYPVQSPKIPASFDRVRIAVFSDLHNCRVGGDQEILLRALRREKPDCILIAGDLITAEKRGRKRVFCDEALRLLRDLPKIAPVYYGMGNHETRWQRSESGTFLDYQREVERLGVTLLDNRSVILRRGKGAVRVTGLNLPPQSGRAKKEEVMTRRIRRLAGPPKPWMFQILLAHDPGFARSYSQWGADLTLAGHYHGGLIRLPLVGGVIAADFSLFPRYDYGRYRFGRRQMIVSSGLGWHTIPLRVNNPPELVLLELRRER